MYFLAQEIDCYFLGADTDNFREKEKEVCIKMYIYWSGIAEIMQ